MQYNNAGVPIQYIYIPNYYTFVITIHVGSPERLSFSALNRIKNHLSSGIKEVRKFFLYLFY